jgi:GT2 family glycosyltransferase
MKKRFSKHSGNSKSASHFEICFKKSYFVPKSSSLELSVIIVNYNVKYFLEQCLLSVQKACMGIDAEILVEDNHSTDGSREYLEPKFPQVKFNWSNTNEGFGKANNRAVKKATGDHILFLNPDTIVAEDCFIQCLDFFKQTPGCGALGVRMIDGSGNFLKESKRSRPSARASFFKMTGLANLFPSSGLFAAYYAGNLPEQANNKVDVLAGAFMLLSRKAIGLTGGYRIQKAGLDNYYFAGTTIIHFKGESTQRLSPVYIRHFYGAMTRFVSKHYRDKKVKRCCMLLAIWFSKMLASVRSWFSKKTIPAISENRVLNTAVIAANQPFNQVVQLLKYARPKLMLYGRIAVDKKDAHAAIGHIDQLNTVISVNKIGQLVLCEDSLSFAEIIRQFQQAGKKVYCLIHARHSDSIVGSSKKNEKGIFIAAPAPAAG